MKQSILFLYILLGILLTNCNEDIDPADKQIYLEGKSMKGIAFFFPLGFYNADALTPKVSFDGRFIAFKSPYIAGESDGGLYVMDLLTKEKTLLHPNGYVPDWSPDGAWIAFNIFPQIHKIKANGDSLTQLTFEGENFLPDWAPGGMQLAYY